MDIVQYRLWLIVNVFDLFGFCLLVQCAFDVVLCKVVCFGGVADQWVGMLV